jgi:hypothetical protein
MHIRRNPLGADTYLFVRPTRSTILGKHPKPESMSLGLEEHHINKPREYGLAMPDPRQAHCDAFQLRDLLGRGPIPYKCEADRVGSVLRNEIDVATIGKSRLVSFGIPTTD